MSTEFKNTPEVCMFSGRMLDPMNPRSYDINIVDIAVGLSQQCRYAGHVWPFYSVAEHSVLISQLVAKEEGGDADSLQLKALLHDAPEYAIGDLIRPIKYKVSGYSEIEDGIMDAVQLQFGIQYSQRDWEIIKFYDDRITISERRKLMPRLPREAYGRGVPEEHIPNVEIRCFPPALAALQFLSAYYSLSGESPTDEERSLINEIVRHHNEN